MNSESSKIPMKFSLKIGFPIDREKELRITNEMESKIYSICYQATKSWRDKKSHRRKSESIEEEITLNFDPFCVGGCGKLIKVVESKHEGFHLDGYYQVIMEASK